MAEHPIGLLADLKFRVTINTDNRLMSGTSMTREFALLAEAFGYGLEDFRWFTVNAMKSAFLPFDERLALIDDVIKPGYAAARPLIDVNGSIDNREVSSDHRSMITERRAVLALRVFLVVLFSVLVVFQTLSMPGQFRYMAEQSPEDAYLRWPLTAIAVFWILCVQVVIVSIWKLLSLVTSGRIFSEESFSWVDLILRAIAAGWVVMVGACVWVANGADDPARRCVLFLLTVAVTVVGSAHGRDARAAPSGDRACGPTWTR